jgi:4-methyl-5(b-hydroxyethyl)-thiazole monophosphate biosynthesis
MPDVLVPLANGVEEMEAVIIIDVLRRAQWKVVTAGIDDGVVTASRGVRLVPDQAWANLDPSGFDVLMIPGGGPGVDRLLKDRRFLETIRDFDRAGKWIGAVCAAPLTLQAAGILEGKRVTCHPGVADALTVTPRLADRVVVDGKLVTSQGPGTTFEFALAMIRLVDGEEKARTLATGMILA